MKTFAMINVNLLNSRKFNSLTASTHMLGYFFFHLRAGYSGIFTYRPETLALDAKVDFTAAKEIINALIETKLIEYEFDESLARIVGWYHQANRPSNVSQLKAQMRDLEDKGRADSWLFVNAVAELAVSAAIYSERWPKDKEPARAELREFVLSHFYEDQMELVEAIEKQLEGKKAARKSLAAIFPMLLTAAR